MTPRTPLPALFPALLLLPLAATPVRALAPAGAPAVVGHPARAARPVPQDFAERRAELDQRFARELEAHAEEAQKARCYARRDAAWTLVIGLEPDHKEARKFLGHKWDRKAEEWVLPKNPREPKDKDEEIAAQLEQELDGLLAGHLERVLALLDAQEGLPPRTRKAELARLLVLSPDDPELRARNGQTRSGDGGAWVLVASERGRQAREAHTTVRKAAIADAPEPTQGTTEEESALLGFEVRAAWATPRMRALGDVGDAELKKVARTTHATYEYLDEVLDNEPLAPCDVFVLESESHKSALVESWPEIEPARRELWRSLIAILVDFDDVAAVTPDKDSRLDGAVRMAVARYLSHHYYVTDRIGWVTEGVGLLVTYQMVGTRKIFTRRVTEYEQGDDKDIGDRMDKPDANWRKLALSSLTSAQSPNLGFTLGRDVNQLTRSDVLASYALAAYMLEAAEPGQFEALLSRIGKGGESSMVVLEDLLGFDPDGLKAHLIQWLQETT